MSLRLADKEHFCEEKKTSLALSPILQELSEQLAKNWRKFNS